MRRPGDTERDERAAPLPTVSPRRAVSEGALFRRVDRLLRREAGSRLRKCSWRSKGLEACGRYYVTDARGFIIERGLQLEADARELGVLGADERLA